MKLLSFIVLMAVAKRCSELDFDLPRPPDTWLFQTAILPGPKLFNHILIHQMAAPCHQLCCHAPFSALTAALLVIAGIETNPGPTNVLQMGLLNVRSMVNKGPLVQDIIVSQKLDVLAVTETWITRDDPDAVKLDAAPAD